MTAALTINEAALPGLERPSREIPNQFSITGLAANRLAEPRHTRLTACGVPASQAADYGLAGKRAVCWSAALRTDTRGPLVVSVPFQTWVTLWPAGGVQ